MLARAPNKSAPCDIDSLIRRETGPLLAMEAALKFRIHSHLHLCLPGGACLTSIHQRFLTCSLAEVAVHFRNALQSKNSMGGYL